MSSAFNVGAEHLPGEPSGVGTVRALFAVFGQGRVDDLLELVSPDVVWTPMTRPGRTRYLGRDGTRDLLDDLHRVYGEFRVELEAVTELDDGTVTVRGRPVRSDHGANAEPVGPQFECLVTLRDGLVVSFDSKVAEAP
jgi:ketosteroid isomerase-like protein